jgi:hypothetical protein
MMKFITALFASAILALGALSPAQADPIGGSQHEPENGCFSVWWLFVGQDCSYDATKFIFTPIWTGPIGLWTYNTRLRQDGDMTITGTGGGATIDATLTLAGGTRTASCGQGAASCTESWDSITHTLETAAVDRAASNAAGGYTYEVASNAFPARLQPCINFGPFPPFNCPNGFNFAGQEYPSVTPSPPFPGPNTGWVAPGPWNEGPSSNDGQPFLPPHFGPNLGRTSSATAVNYACVAVGGGSCASTALIGGSLGYENVLLQVDTNAAGGIINATMSYTHEYTTVIPNDSWAGNIVEMSGFIAVAKPGADPDVQIDKKNPLSVVVYGTSNLDVRSIDIPSLNLQGGLFTFPTAGGEIHGKGHYGDVDGDQIEDLTAHFASNESDLRCGANEARLNGVSDVVPFTTTVTYIGIGKACD